MQTKKIIKDSYPGSEKIYLPGKIHDIRVGMRKVKLTDTVKIVEGKRVATPNGHVYIYDTSGAYTDPNIEVDLKKGLPRLREAWIKQRADAEQLPEISSEYGKQLLSDTSPDSRRFAHIQLLYRATKRQLIKPMYYVR